MNDRLFDEPLLGVPLFEDSPPMRLAIPGLPEGWFITGLSQIGNQWRAEILCRRGNTVVKLSDSAIEAVRGAIQTGRPRDIPYWPKLHAIVNELTR